METKTGLSKSWNRSTRNLTAASCSSLTDPNSELISKIGSGVFPFTQYLSLRTSKNGPNFPNSDTYSFRKLN